MILSYPTNISSYLILFLSPLSVLSPLRRPQTVFFEGQSPVFKSVDDIQFLLPVSVDSVMEFTATVVYSQDLFIVVQVNWNDVNTQKIEGSGCVQVIEFLVTFFFFSDGQVDAFKVNPTSSYRSKTNVLSYIFQAPKVVEYIRQVSIGTRTEFLSIFFFLIPCSYIP